MRLNLQQEERQLRASMRAMSKQKSRRQLRADLQVENMVTKMRRNLRRGGSLGSADDDELVEDKYYTPTADTSVSTSEFGKLGCGCKNADKKTMLKWAAVGLLGVAALLFVRPML